MSRSDDRLLRHLHRHGRHAAVRPRVGDGRSSVDGTTPDARTAALQTTTLQPHEDIPGSQGRPLVQVVTSHGHMTANAFVCTSMLSSLNMVLPMSACSVRCGVQLQRVNLIIYVVFSLVVVESTMLVSPTADDTGNGIP